MVTLRVPLSQKDAIREILQLTEENRQAIVAVLRDSAPAKSPEETADRIARAASIPKDSAIGMVKVFLSLYMTILYKGYDAVEIAASVAEATSADANLPAAETAPLRDFLLSVLQQEKLGLTAKALDLAQDTERRLCTSRIVTDLRPVFGADVKDGPAGAVINHTLELTYHCDDDDDNRIFIGLKPSQLRSLRASIDRALEKHESLAKHAGLMIFLEN